MADRTAALRLLRRLLDNEAAEFRDGRWEAIDALVNRRERLLLVQRTGWGKSAVYFVATRILRDGGAGATLIVSPLLALMRNQVVAAERMDIRAMSADPAEDLYRKVRSLVRPLCVEPKQAREIAGALGVTKPTADAWIRRLVEERVLNRESKPARYVTREKDLLG